MRCAKKANKTDQTSSEGTRMSIAVIQEEGNEEDQRVSGRGKRETGYVRGKMKDDKEI